MVEKTNDISDMMHDVYIYKATIRVYEDFPSPRRRCKFDHAGVSMEEGTERSSKVKILYQIELFCRYNFPTQNIAI